MDPSEPVATLPVGDVPGCTGIVVSVDGAMGAVTRIGV